MAVPYSGAMLGIYSRVNFLRVILLRVVAVVSSIVVMEPVAAGSGRCIPTIVLGCLLSNQTLMVLSKHSGKHLASGLFSLVFSCSYEFHNFASWCLLAAGCWLCSYPEKSEKNWIINVMNYQDRW